MSSRDFRQVLERRRAACRAVIEARRKAYLSPMRMAELERMDLKKLLQLFCEAERKAFQREVREDREESRWGRARRDAE